MRRQAREGRVQTAESSETMLHALCLAGKDLLKWTVNPEATEQSAAPG